MSTNGQGEIFLLLQELPAKMLGTPLPAGLKLNAAQDSFGFKSRRREQPITCPIWPCGPLDFQLVLVHHAEVPFAHHFMVHG